jgi:hypothetical protein
MTVKWALVKTSPFQGLSEDEKHDILSRMLCVHYDPGERLELGREPGRLVGRGEGLDEGLLHRARWQRADLRHP